MRAHTSILPPTSDWPRAVRKRSLTHMRSGRAAAARPPGAKVSMTSTTVGPCHQVASCGACGGDVMFCPSGADAGSHLTALSRNPHDFRNGPSTDLHTWHHDNVNFIGCSAQATEMSTCTFSESTPDPSCWKMDDRPHALRYQNTHCLFYGLKHSTANLT